jgi:phage anti-repressor protein
MSIAQFSPELALSLSNSRDEFPVDFNLAWQWLGFSTKGNAKASLLDCGFIEGQDYKNDLMINHKQAPSTFQSTEREIRLTIEAFKSWGMMSRTEQGKVIRKYFLECEKTLKAKKFSQSDLDRDKERKSGVVARREYTDIIQTFNPTSKDYAIATNHAYRGAFGMNAAQIKIERGLKKKQSARDGLNTVELAVIRLTELAIARKSVDTLNQLNEASFKQAEAISQALKVI